MRSIRAALAAACAGIIALGAPAAVGPPKGALAPAGNRVIDHAGNPLAGVEVFAQAPMVVPAIAEVRETSRTVTGADGAFDYPSQLVPGSSVIFTKPGFARRTFDSAGMLPREVTLGLGGRITGCVVDDRGASVTDAVLGPIRLLEGGGESALSSYQFVRVDANGCFEISDIPKAARIGFVVSSPAAVPQYVTASAGETAKRIVLSRSGVEVRGVILGSRGRTPQPGRYAEARSGSLTLFEKADASGRFAFSLLPRAADWQMRAAVSEADRPNPMKTVSTAKDTATSEVTLLVDEGILVAGIAVDADTSEPVANVSIALEGGKLTSAQTDARGRFDFADASAFGDLVLRVEGSRYICVTGEAGGANYVMLPPSRGDDLTTVELRLRKRVVASGVVLNQSERPVPDADVLLKSQGEATVRIGKKLGQPEYRARTDASGRFSVAVYPPGPYVVSASTDALISDPQTVDVYSTSPVNLRLVVYAGAVALGTVTDPAGQPVTGAEVQAVDEQDSTPLRSVVSGKKGEFRIDGLRPRRIALNATHPGYVQSASLSTDLALYSSSPLTLRFPEGNGFSALVTGEGGQPVSGAVVTLLYSEGFSGKSVSVSSGRDGRVSVASLPAGVLDRVSVTKSPEYVRFEVEGISLPARDYALQLQKCPMLHVSLTKADGDAASEATVWLLYGGMLEAEPPSSSFTSHLQDKIVNGEAWFRFLEPGWYKVVVRAGGSLSQSKPVRLVAGKPAEEIALSLDSPGFIKGTVLDMPNRKAIQGAIVTAVPSGSLPEDVGAAITASGADGSFTLSPVPQGSVLVVATHPDYPKASVRLEVPAGGLSGAEIPMSSQLSTLSGKVTLDGAAVAGALLVLYSSEALESPVGKAMSDASGTYKIADVAPAAYRLVVDAPVGDGDQEAQKSFEVAVGTADQQNVFDVALEKPTLVKGTVRVAGKSLSAPDAPKALTFTGKSGGGASAEIMPGGKFEVSLSPGVYTVGLEDRPGQEITIPASAEPYAVQLSY